MKKLLKFLGAAAFLLGMTAALAACSAGNTPYDDLGKEGYTVTVRYDAGGGTFTSNTSVRSDVFNPSHYTAKDGVIEIPLLALDDPNRGKDAFEGGAKRNGYYLAGWYTEREIWKNDAGETLDVYGNPIPEGSDTEPGYTYSGKWDFDKDTVKIQADSEYSATEPVITLYAAWVPYYVYEVYATTPEGETVLVGETTGLSLTVPEWDKETGKIMMGDFPEWRGHTLWNVYTDEAMTEKAEGSYSGSYDEETATVTVGKVKFYTEWREGNWYKIYTAKQLYDYSKSSAANSYYLCADLDFADVAWANSLASKTYSGTLEGNGYKISNVKLAQTDFSQTMGGLFGSLGAKAAIRNVEFENVTVTLEKGSRVAGARFGLLCGDASTEAALENVTVSGTLVIGKSCQFLGDYSIGLMTGNGDIAGVSSENIECRAEEGSGITVTEENGIVSVTFPL